VTKRDNRTTQAFKDFCVVIAISFLVFSLGYFFDFFEWLVEWSRKYDAKTLDEYVALLILLMISFSFFSYRRWSELRYEVKERKKAEEAIRNLNKELEDNVVKLTEANKELDTFNNTVSHDLQTPLTIIGGFTNRLLKIYGSQLEPSAKDMLNIIQLHTQKMASFIKDLLAFSRSGREQLKKTEIDMNELFMNILDELKPLTNGRQIHFEIQKLHPVHGDKTLFKQVLINLITNAIKFTRQKSPAKIEVGCTQNKEEDIYWIRDNGIGFNQREGDKLFSLFQRLHENENIEGTGIGLSIVHRILDRHGGRVWAEGKVNEGATFYFSLPNQNRIYN
jgi:two-component system sensor kinase